MRPVMPAVFTCAACRNRLRLADHLAGKRVKCTKCGQAGTVAAAENGSTPAAERVKATCPGCAKVVEVKAELAGKAVKCPGCGKAMRGPQEGAARLAAPTQEAAPGRPGERSRAGSGTPPRLAAPTADDEW